VPLEEPSWWYGGAPTPALLAPLGRLYGGIAEWRFRRHAPYRSRLPVICIGNFTAGGTGKTPLSILIAKMLQAQAVAPAFLTRGYGGRESGPAWVDTEAGGADRFGDEPLLLARAAPTVVARDRALGAQLIEASGRGITAIIMDDGLQNPSLAKDLTIAVVDGVRGLGNGAVIPAGPLRAPIDFQMGLVDAVGVTVNGDTTETLELMRHRFPGPVLELQRSAAGEVDWLRNTPVVAFAGIANPERFFALLEQLGAAVAQRIAFRDHHTFTRDDAERLLALAARHDAALVTTEKDWVRLQGNPELPPRLLDEARTLAIETTLAARDRKRLDSLLATAMQKRGVESAV
jgi:tetraacyldisaccharide 4'-kinase